MKQYSFEVQIMPTVKCLTPCLHVDGRFIGSGNCKSACHCSSYAVYNTRGGIQHGAVFCKYEDKEK